MKLGEMVEGEILRTRATVRLGTVAERHPVCGVKVAWADGSKTWVHPDCEVDSMGFEEKGE